MIWVKRMVPLIIAVAFFFGYRYYTKAEQTSRALQSALHAEVTAKLWLASAYYRTDTERFIMYRDSILGQAGLSLKEANEYLDVYRGESEQYRSFVQNVAQLVDSLARFDKIHRPVPELAEPGSDSL